MGTKKNRVCSVLQLVWSPLPHRYCISNAVGAYGLIFPVISKETIKCAVTIYLYVIIDIKKMLQISEDWSLFRYHYVP